MSEIKGLCHICGKKAERTCSICGRAVCEEHMARARNVCTSCAAGRR